MELEVEIEEQPKFPLYCSFDFRRFGFFLVLFARKKLRVKLNRKKKTLLVGFGFGYIVFSFSA